MLLCRNFEDTVECKLAWDLVEDLSKGIPPPHYPAYVDEEICEARAVWRCFHMDLSQHGR
jgi:hypothetical protein